MQAGEGWGGEVGVWEVRGRELGGGEEVAAVSEVEEFPS